MGGAGHMLHAIKSLKANRDLLKQKRAKQPGKRTSFGGEKLRFKTVGPEELARIKAGIRADARRSLRKQVLIFGVSLALLLFTLILVFS